MPTSPRLFRAGERFNVMGNPTMIRGMVFLLLASAAVPRAGAVEVLHDGDAIRACLCLDRAVTTLSDQLDAESQAYDDQRKALAALEDRAAAARQQIDPANKAQREALVRLLDERDAAVRRFAEMATPHHNDIVARYGDAAEAFNHACGDKSYDWTVLQQVQDGLSCPSTPRSP
jgi:hypothetical protein